MNDRCGKCEACQKVEGAKRVTMAVVNAAANRGLAVDDCTIEIWNSALVLWPCEQPVKPEAHNG